MAIQFLDIPMKHGDVPYFQLTLLGRKAGHHWEATNRPTGGLAVAAAAELRLDLVDGKIRALFLALHATQQPHRILRGNDDRKSWVSKGKCGMDVVELIV